MMKRREFIQRGIYAAAGIAGSGSLALAEAAGKRPRVGVQLYSIHTAFQKDMEGTLKAVRAIGYEGVEFAGYFGKSAKELRAMLDGCGLVACGSHVGMDDIRPEKIAATIAFNREIGNPYLMVPGVPAKTEKDWLDAARVFSQAAETAKAAGMYVGYHNHEGALKDRFHNKCVLEIFFTAASPDVCMQLDTGNAANMGEDPAFWLRRFPGRCRTIHLKEAHSTSSILGNPDAGKKGIAWPSVFAAAEAEGTQWYIVECEARPDSLEAIGASFKFLKACGKA